MTVLVATPWDSVSPPSEHDGIFQPERYAYLEFPWSLCRTIFPPFLSPEVEILCTASRREAIALDRESTQLRRCSLTAQYLLLV